MVPLNRNLLHLTWALITYVQYSFWIWPADCKIWIILAVQLSEVWPLFTTSVPCNCWLHGRLDSGCSWCSWTECLKSYCSSLYLSTDCWVCVLKVFALECIHSLCILFMKFIRVLAFVKYHWTNRHWKVKRCLKWQI